MTKAEFLNEIAALTRTEADSIKTSTVLIGLKGWDSLKTVEFRMFVEDELGREIDGLTVERAKTVGDLMDCIIDLLDDP